MCFWGFFSSFSTFFSTFFSVHCVSQTQWVPPPIHHLLWGEELFPRLSNSGSSTIFPVLRPETGCAFWLTHLRPPCSQSAPGPVQANRSPTLHAHSLQASSGPHVLISRLVRKSWHRNAPRLVPRSSAPFLHQPATLILQIRTVNHISPSHKKKKKNLRSSQNHIPAWHAMPPIIHPQTTSSNLVYNTANGESNSNN